MDIVKVAEKYKTPLYIYELSALKRRTDMMRRCLPGIDLCFAMKAAPVLAGRIKAYIDRLEVCSPGEYEICVRQGVEREKLLVSGVNKTEASVRRILSLGGDKSVFTIESPEHFRILDKCSRESGKILSCYVRLSSGNQFGVDEASLEEITEAVLNAPMLSLVGIHYFSGTQKTMKRISEELSYLAEYGRKLRDRLGVDWFELEYGPGLGVTLFHDKKDPEDRYTAKRNETEYDRIMKRGDEEAEAQLTELMGLVRAAELGSVYDHITFEHGRFIAASSGRYITGVADVKTTAGVNYAIVDGGLHQLTYYGSMNGMRVPYVDKLSADADSVSADENSADVCRDYMLAGSLCSVNDILVRSIRLPELKPGDMLSFNMAGAYTATEGMSLFLSRDIPAIVILDEDGNDKLIRNHIEMNGLNDGSLEELV